MSAEATRPRILTTLLAPDEGSANAAGFDVVDDPARVRERIGLAGQYAAVDENLTGFENLQMVGRLYHLGRAAASARARELLEAHGLVARGFERLRLHDPLPGHVRLVRLRSTGHDAELAAAGRGAQPLHDHGRRGARAFRRRPGAQRYLGRRRLVDRDHRRLRRPLRLAVPPDGRPDLTCPS